MAKTKTYPEMTELYFQVTKAVPVGSLWRHKAGDVYEVIGIDMDSDDGNPRVRYQVRVSPHVAPGSRNVVVFSRPYHEWTLDRFAPLS